MGIVASWTSVAGLSKAEVLDRLGLVETERTVSLADDWFDRDDAGGIAVLPSGRVLIVSEYSDFATPVVAAKVSIGAELVMASMDERTMYSEAFGYRDGEQVWSIGHNPEQNRDGVDVTGEPPSEYHIALAEVAREEEEVGGADYFFSVPAAVTGAIGGYRADEDLPGFDNRVTVVASKAEADRLAAKAARAEARKASGGLAGAVKRLFGGR